jgi:hypothetical protein
MRVDLRKIRELTRDAKDFHAHIDGIFEKCIEEQDTPLLSDLIAGFNEGGVYLMEALAQKYHDDRDMPAESRFYWKLYCKRDEWGNAPAKGDIVYRRIQKPMMHGPGKHVTASELSLDIVNGTYDKKWHRYIPYKVDEKGCITCEFNDASYFIRSFGIHPISKRGGHPMSLHLREHSEEPVKAPDGNMLHVWYWRFMEMDGETYKKLPKLTERKEPKRGFLPEEINKVV